MVRVSAALTTVTAQPGQEKAYVPEPSGALTRTCTSWVVNSTSPQSGQLALIVAMSSRPQSVYFLQQGSHRHGVGGP